MKNTTTNETTRKSNKMITIPKRNNRKSYIHTRRYTLAFVDKEKANRREKDNNAVFGTAVQHHLNIEVTRIDGEKEITAPRPETTHNVTRRFSLCTTSEVGPTTNSTKGAPVLTRCHSFNQRNKAIPVTKKMYSPFPCISSASLSIKPNVVSPKRRDQESRMRARSLYSIAMMNAL